MREILRYIYFWEIIVEVMKNVRQECFRDQRQAVNIDFAFYIVGSFFNSMDLPKNILITIQKIFTKAFKNYSVVGKLQAVLVLDKKVDSNSSSSFFME